MRAQRLVAASVSSAEILLAIVPREHIAAVHYLAADPLYSMVAGQVRDIPTIGASPEQILSVRPDLVVTDEFTRAETQRLLEAVGVPVLRIEAPASFDEVTRNIARLGYCLDRDQQARALIDRMRLRIEEIRTESSDLPQWRVMNLNGDLDTYGRNSLFDAAVELAGALNVPAEQGVGAYQKLDIETVMAWRPDALVIESEPGWIERDPLLPLLRCVRQQRYVRVPSALLSCQSHNAVELAARLQEQLRAWGRP